VSGQLYVAAALPAEETWGLRDGLEVLEWRKALAFAGIRTLKLPSSNLVTLPTTPPLLSVIFNILSNFCLMIREEILHSDFGLRIE
jgi:hypothetical protein